MKVSATDASRGEPELEWHGRHGDRREQRAADRNVAVLGLVSGCRTCAADLDDGTADVSVISRHTMRCA